MPLPPALIGLYQSAALFVPAIGRPAQPFVIVGAARSGSTLLQSLLGSHPHVVCMNEILGRSARKTQFRRYYAGQRGRLRQVGKQDPARLAETVLLSPQPPGVRAIGFKLLYNQPADLQKRDELWNRLASWPELRVLRTVSNPARSALSFCIAMETGKWVNQQVDGDIRVDTDLLLNRLRKDDQRAAKVASLFTDGQVLDVRAKEVLHDPEASAALLRHIGVEPRPLTTTTKRQNPVDMAQVVANYDEVLAALEGTEWEGQL